MQRLFIRFGPFVMLFFLKNSARNSERLVSTLERLSLKSMIKVFGTKVPTQEGSYFEMFSYNFCLLVI